MAERRYYDSDLVPVTQLAPGAAILQRRIVIAVSRTAEQAVVTFDDGTTQTFTLAGDPSVEVVAAGLE